MSGCWRLAVAAGLMPLPALAWAQSVEPVAAPAAAASDVAAAAVPPASPPMPIQPSNTDPAVEAYYAAHPGPLWLRDEDTRAAAAELANRLKHAELDGLSDGARLAASVEEALAHGQPADDKIIASAWIAYVRALKRPVDRIGYGEPTLALKPPATGYLLEQAGKAPSLREYLEQSTALTPFYSVLRSNALAQGLDSDPRVRASLDRLRLLPAKGRAILVDVANAELMTLEDGGVIDRMKVIVGKPDAQTPLLAGKIYYVTLNPYWHIPQDVAKRKVAPIILKRGTAYLKAARYQTVAAFGGDKEEPIDPETIDWKAVAAGDVDAHIRQLAGPNNMMGAMKFGFVNDEGIYLHDTPHKDLFKKTKRTLSLGCVRVEQPERLAAWLLGHDPAPPSDEFEKLVQLDSGVPIYILYLTARPDGDSVAFAPDVYGLDTPVPVKTASIADQPVAH